MAIGIYEAKKMTVDFHDAEGAFHRTTGHRSEEWSGYHFYLESGGYLGLVTVKPDAREFVAFDGNGANVGKKYKTMLGAVKKLYTLSLAALADAPTSCDACGYDIAVDDYDAQATEENGEVISTCGGCADELGTLVLDARNGKLNRQAPRGKRPEPATDNVEAALDRVAASLSLAGPVIERLRKSVVDDEPTLAGLYANRNGEQYIIREHASAGADSYTLRKSHANAGYTSARRADVEDWIASGWLTLVTAFDNGSAFALVERRRQERNAAPVSVPVDFRAANV